MDGHGNGWSINQTMDVLIVNQPQLTLVEITERMESGAVWATESNQTLHANATLWM